ncbi:MAG: pyridoxamine 5'-phosphate oxidase family protein [Lachnospiraceae bacterium]|nr:pyridoxamine 5'-phosphate oxidase family protein [Lachnospiraceae bacterium]
MEQQEYEQASRFWTDKEEHLKRMTDDRLSKEIDHFLEAHNTCALATGTKDFVRCTPIEYTYFDKKLWMLSEGGLKFKALAENKHVCIAVYDTYSGFGNVKGMQITGEAEMVPPFSESYQKVLEYKKIPAEAIRKLSHPMYLIQVTPKRIDILNSNFKKEGFDSRQFLID